LHSWDAGGAVKGIAKCVTLNNKIDFEFVKDTKTKSHETNFVLLADEGQVNYYWLVLATDQGNLLNADEVQI